MTTPTGRTGPDRTLVERLLGGDWRSAVAVAVPTVVVTYALAMLVSTYLLWVGDDEFAAHSEAGYFHAAGSLAAMALGSPLFVHGTEDAADSEGLEVTATFFGGIAPLTISLLVLVTFALLLRSYQPAGAGTSARLTAAVRAALLTAVGAAALGFTAFADNAMGGADVTVSPARIFGWSLLWFGLVGLLVANRPREWLAARSESDPRMARLVEAWWLPVQGAVAAMSAAVILGGLAGIAVMFIEAGNDPLGVVEALPLVFAYFVNLGIDVFQFAMGAPLSAGISGPQGGDSSVWLFDRQGIPAGYITLILLVPLAVAAGVLRMRRFRGEVDAQHLARSCYRMALPALLLYLAIAIPSRAGFGAEGPGPAATGHAGPSILLGSVILVAWFVVLGYAAGRWLLRDSAPATPAGPGPGAAFVRRRWSSRRLHAVPLTLGALAVVVATAGGGVATASDNTDESGDIGPISGLFVFLFFATADVESGSLSGEVTEVTPEAPQLSDTAVQGDLQEVGLAEERYYAEHGTYTVNEFELDVAVPASVRIVVGDSVRFCAEASADTGQVYVLDTDAGGAVTAGFC